MNTEEIIEKIISNVSDKFEISNDRITFDSSFKSIGADSLDIVEIIVEMEKEFNVDVPDSKLLKLLTVGSLAEYIDASLNHKRKRKHVRKSN
jgi:acyl carrier protein